MHKVIVFFKYPLSFPVTILILNYFYWLITTPMSLFDDNFGNYFAGMILLIVYILFIALAKVVSKNRIFTLIFVILALPILLLLTSYTTWFLSTGQNGVKHLPTIVVISTELLLTTIYSVTVLLSNQGIENRNTTLVLFFIMLPVLGASFVYPIHFYPEILEEAEGGSYKYYIVSSVDWDNHGYQTFYKCRFWRMNCIDLAFSYSGFSEIIVDEQNKEVSLLGMFGLMYTDGENPRNYTQPAAIYEDHIYQFSSSCNNLNNNKGYYSCESHTYQLYECDMNYKSCISLPIQYTSQGSDTFLVIEGWEESNAINVYNDSEDNPNRTLILTYGEKPTCYVEGCKILMEVK